MIESVNHSSPTRLPTSSHNTLPVYHSVSDHFIVHGSPICSFSDPPWDISEVRYAIPHSTLNTCNSVALHSQGWYALRFRLEHHNGASTHAESVTNGQKIEIERRCGGDIVGGFNSAQKGIRLPEDAGPIPSVKEKLRCERGHSYVDGAAPGSACSRWVESEVFAVLYSGETMSLKEIVELGWCFGVDADAYLHHESDFPAFVFAIELLFCPFEKHGSKEAPAHEFRHVSSRRYQLPAAPSAAAACCLFDQMHSASVEVFVVQVLTDVAGLTGVGESIDNDDADADTEHSSVVTPIPGTPFVSKNHPNDRKRLKIDSKGDGEGESESQMRQDNEADYAVPSTPVRQISSPVSSPKTLSMSISGMSTPFKRAASSILAFVTPKRKREDGHGHNRNYGHIERTNDLLVILKQKHALFLVNLLKFIESESESEGEGDVDVDGVLLEMSVEANKRSRNGDELITLWYKLMEMMCSASTARADAVMKHYILKNEEYMSKLRHDAVQVSQEAWSLAYTPSSYTPHTIHERFAELKATNRAETDSGSSSEVMVPQWWPDRHHLPCVIEERYSHAHTHGDEEESGCVSDSGVMWDDLVMVRPVEDGEKEKRMESEMDIEMEEEKEKDKDQVTSVLDIDVSSANTSTTTTTTTTHVPFSPYMARSASHKHTHKHKQKHKQTYTKHIVFLIHGLDASPYDMQAIRSRLLHTWPDVVVCVSEANPDTHTAIDIQGHRLAEEVVGYVARKISQSHDHFVPLISFVSHSLGSLLVRSAISQPLFTHLLPRLHLFVSIAGVHLGASSWHVDAAMKIWRVFRTSPCMAELGLADSTSRNLRSCTLVKLSEKEVGSASTERDTSLDTAGHLSHFPRILLVGSSQDKYASHAGARIQYSVQSVSVSEGKGKGKGKEEGEEKDTCLSSKDEAYKYMVSQLLGPPLHPSRVRRIEAVFNLPSTLSSLNVMIGRAAHLELMQNEAFIDILIDRMGNFAT